jgi:hypothetical protein
MWALWGRAVQCSAPPHASPESEQRARCSDVRGLCPSPWGKIAPRTPPQRSRTSGSSCARNGFRERVRIVRGYRSASATVGIRSSHSDASLTSSEPSRRSLPPSHCGRAITYDVRRSGRALLRDPTRLAPVSNFSGLQWTVGSVKCRVSRSRSTRPTFVACFQMRLPCPLRGREGQKRGVEHLEGAVG